VISRIHQKLGTAGFVTSIVALVAALCGGAYAAGGGLTGKQKKEVKKIAKQYAGERGPRGKNGQNGQNGSNGAPGAKGDAGAQGEQGAKGDRGEKGEDGSPGEDGKSVEEFVIAPEEPACEELGGAEYVVEGETEGTQVCNGKEGSPWTAGGTLPKGATETGTWAVSANPGLADSEGNVYVPISFPIPLENVIEFGTGKVHIVGESGGGECQGTVYEPKAHEGELCIYVAEKHGINVLQTEDLERAPNAASKTGTVLVFNEVLEHAWATGSWAVTGS
jgi:hypothetical protein